jgi:hypothetical protein
VIDYSATKLSSNIQPLGTAEASGTCSGVLALDVDNDGKVEYLAIFPETALGFGKIISGSNMAIRYLWKPQQIPSFHLQSFR